VIPSNAFPIDVSREITSLNSLPEMHVNVKNQFQEKSLEKISCRQRFQERSQPAGEDGRTPVK